MDFLVDVDDCGVDSLTLFLIVIVFASPSVLSPSTSSNLDAVVFTRQNGNSYNLVLFHASFPFSPSSCRNISIFFLLPLLQLLLQILLSHLSHLLNSFPTVVAFFLHRSI